MILNYKLIEDSNIRFTQVIQREQHNATIGTGPVSLPPLYSRVDSRVEGGKEEEGP